MRQGRAVGPGGRRPADLAGRRPHRRRHRLNSRPERTAMKPAFLIAAAAAVLAGLAAPVALSAAEPQQAAAAVAPAPRPYPQLTHVAWVVPNLDKALADSAAQLGTKPANLVFRRVLTVDRGTYQGRPAHFSAEFALLELGNTQFEFIQPLTGTSPYSDALKGHRGAVLHHL